MVAGYPCQNGGNCYNNGLTATCSCPVPYIGRFCEINNANCQNVVCQNGGTCVEATGTCDCAGTLYTGTLCQAETITCTPSPCRHDTSCLRVGPNNITCSCKGSGYTGSHCQVAILDDCRTSEYACASQAQCLTNLETDTSSCHCGTRYLGASCDIDLVWIILVGGLLLLAAGAYWFMRRKFPHAANSVILGVTLAAFDFVSDVLFVYSQKDVDGSVYAASLAFLAIPIMWNLLVLGYLFISNLLNNQQLQHWLRENTAVASASMLLALTNIEVVEILHSRLFYSAAFSAPLGGQFLHRLSLAALVGSLLEDVPQLIIQSVVASRKLTTITLLSITASVLSLAFGIIKKGLAYMVSRITGASSGYHKQGEDDELGEDPGLTTEYYGGK